MPQLKIFRNLTLVFINGHLRVIHRKGKAYKVHEVRPLQDLKFNLGKSDITLADIKQLIEAYSRDINFEFDGDRIILRNINLN